MNEIDLNQLAARQPLGVITDMDGTLSLVAPTPDAAQVTPRARDLLRQLHAQGVVVAVVSGRAVADLRERVGLPDLLYVGNHGLERWHNGQIDIVPEASGVRPAVAAAAAELRPRLLPGMFLEDKQVTLSLHYRKTDDPAAVQALFAPLVQAAAASHGLTAYEGRMVFEVRPPIQINKGTSFRRLVADYGLQAAVYLGDDTTDADALNAARALRESGECYSFGVGVDSEETPDSVRDAADMLVPGVSGVENWLEKLLSALSASRS